MRLNVTKNASAAGVKIMLATVLAAEANKANNLEQIFFKFTSLQVK